MKRRNTRQADRTVCALMLASAAGGAVLFFKGELFERLLWKPNLLAAAELLLVCALLCGIYRGCGLHKAAGDASGAMSADGTRRLYSQAPLSQFGAMIAVCLAGLLVLAEVWLHQLLLPFVCSGLWFAFLAGVLLFFGKNWQDEHWQSADCSRNRLNDNRNREDERKNHMVFGAESCLHGCLSAIQSWLDSENGRIWLRTVFCALPFLLIQLNRMNIAFDYDSLRYGLRSQFVLGGNGLSGFFDSLGQVNTVYTYPKGLEVLTLPLAHFRSFSFMVCFQFWTLLACLLTAAGIVRRLTAGEKNGRICCGFGDVSAQSVCAARTKALQRTDAAHEKDARAALCFLLLSAVCGISNMAVTAKTDLITLLFQLLMLRLFLDRRPVAATAAAVLTLSFKPTALVFTSAAWIAAAGVFLRAEMMRKRRMTHTKQGTDVKSRDAVVDERDWDALSLWTNQHQHAIAHQNQGKPYQNNGCLLYRDAILLVCALVFTGVMWLRTYVITGMPSTSVFTSVWELLGFQAKWPYNFSPLPSEGFDNGIAAGLLKFAKRVLLLLFCPLGGDMEHVLMAWGGPLMPALSYLAVRSAARALYRGGKKCGIANTAHTMLAAVYVLITLGSLASLYLLWQVDGNYYMLWYALTVIMALGGWDEKSQTHFGGIFPKLYRIKGQTGFAMLLALSLPVMLLTGWAGGVGFTPARVLNSGYYDNLAEIQRWEQANGSAGLWAFLSANPKNRVVAFADAPECYYFACNVQSYTDIEGSGGNVRLVKTLNDFKAFLDWAGTDYIYFDTSYLARGSNERAASLMRDLIEDGTVTELRVETLEPDARTPQTPDMAENGQTTADGIANAAAKHENPAGSDAPNTAVEHENPADDTGAEANQPEHQRFSVCGRIDKARVKEPWQTPQNPQAAEQSAEQLKLFEALMRETR